MILYITLALVCLLPVLFSRTNKGLLFSCILIAGFLSLRCDFGDYFGYYDLNRIIAKYGVKHFFETQKNWSVFSNHPTLHVEYGYLLFQAVFPFRFFIFIAFHAFFFMECIYLLIKKCVAKEYYPLALLLLLDPIILLINMSALRQSFAISLFILAFLALTKKRWKPSLILILLSGCFHRSALVLGIFLLLPIFRREKYGIEFFYIVFFLLVGFSIFFLRSFVEATGFYSEYLGGGQTSRWLISFLLMIPIILAMQKMQSGSDEVLYATIIYSMIIFTRLVGLIPGMSLISRYSLFFDVFSIVALPMCLPRLKISNFIVCCFLICYVVVRTITFFNSPRFVGEDNVDFSEQNIITKWEDFSQY